MVYIKGNVLLQVKIVQMKGSEYVVNAIISGEEVRLKTMKLIFAASLLSIKE